LVFCYAGAVTILLQCKKITPIDAIANGNLSTSVQAMSVKLDCIDWVFIACEGENVTETYGNIISEN